jgi:hypothetical protein
MKGSEEWFNKEDLIPMMPNLIRVNNRVGQEEKKLEKIDEFDLK